MLVIGEASQVRPEDALGAIARRPMSRAGKLDIQLQIQEESNANG